MKYVSLVAGAWLVALLFFLWGAAAAHYEVFPGPTLQAWLATPETTTTVDTDQAAITALRKAQRQNPYGRSADRNYRNLTVPGLKDSRTSPRLYQNPSRQTGGYRFIAGQFNFRDHPHGAILLDDNGRVVHTWSLNEAHSRRLLDARNAQRETPLAPTPPDQRQPHGVALLPDASIVINDGDPGYGLQRLDACGRSLWRQPGAYRTLSLDPDNAVLWTFEGTTVVALDLDTGRVLKRLDWDAVREANPAIDLDIRVVAYRGKWFDAPWQPSHVEPLPRAWTDAFPAFRAGDLLITHRAINLVTVVDPASLAIKWWRVGTARRPGDAHWQDDGTLSVFNSNVRVARGAYQDLDRYSGLVTIDPDTLSARTVYDGRAEAVYTEYRGSHQKLPNGNWLLTSAEQGRVLEVLPPDRTVFELHNAIGPSHNLPLSGARWLPDDYLNPSPEDLPPCDT